MEPENVELNPITNLPVRRAPVNPITGKPLTQSQLSSPFTGDPMAYGFTRDMSEYTDYGVKVTPYQDIEEARAEAQPGYEQAYRGTLKALGTFGTAVGMGIAGSVEGLKRLEDQFEVGGLDNVNISRAFGEENETNKYLNQLNEELREYIPNYKTQEELQSIGTFRGMFNTNFIFDDALNGFAFLGGAAATAWLTGGAGISGAVGGAAGSLGRFAMLSPRVAAGVNALKASRAAQASFSAANAAKMRAAAFATAVKATPALKAASNLPGAAAAGRVGSKLFSVNSIRGLETGFLMSTSEAAVEAFEVKNQYKEKLIQEALKKYNVESEYDLPVQVQQNINQLAENVGAVSFSANLPMLMATNMFAFRQLLRPVLAPRIAGLSTKAGKAVYAPGSKALRVGKVLGAESLSEAIQEGYQWGIQETLINQDLNKYNDFGSADMFYGLAKARENDFIDALKKTPELVGKLAEAPFNPEGRHAMILGGLIGGIVSGIRLSTGNQFEQEDKRGEAAKEFLNSEFFGNLQQRAARSNRVSTHLKNKEIFEKEGNTEAAERELAAIFQEEALFHVQNGSWDVFLERLALEAEKPLDEFKKDFDIQDDNYTAEDQKKTVKKLAEQLTDLAIYSDSLSFLFPTIERPTGLKRTLTSKKRMQEIDDQIKEQEIIRGAILRSHFTIGNLNEKITETAERMKQEIPEIANMIDDIVNTRRSLFGELFSKAERAQKDIKDEELYNSIKIKSDELVDKLNKAAEGIQDPVHQVLFNIYAQKLVDLTQERDNYELAKNNLVRSPSKRDLFVSRTKLAEENKIFEAREKVLKEAIESAKTSKELADQKASLGKEIDSHPELKLQLSNAITAKLKEENDINERFNGLTLTEVKALTGLSPQEEYVRKLHLAKRAQESPITPKKEQAKKEPPKKPEEKKEKEEKPEGKKSTKEKLKSRRKKQGEQLRKKVGSLISLRNHNRTTINQQTFGEFEVEEVDGKSYVVVDSKGSPNEGNSRRLNGAPIINHGLMNSPNIKVGDTVELKVIEDDWWTSNPNVPRDHIQAPIYILVKGVPIGILQSGDHPVREAAWNAHINKTGEVISTTITEKNRGYIFNAVQADGESREKYFYSLKTVENDLLASEYNVPNVLGVVKNNGEIELNIVPKEEDAFELQAKIAAELNANGLTPGQVFMVQVSPNGKITILPLQTATLNQIARDQAAQLLDNLIEFEKVVGTTNLSTILNVADEGLGELSPLAVEPTSGDIIFKPVGDSVPAELMQAAEAMGGNLFIRIPASLLKQMWNREEVKFDQATFLDLLVYVQTKENDDGTTKQVFEQYHQKLSGEEYSKLIGMLKPQIAYIFNDLLLVKRYNVNIATLSNSKAYTEEYTSSFTGNTYKNYYEYLTAEEENASERNGTAAILGASFTNVNKSLDGSGGSVFYDTEIKLNPEYSVNGVAVTAQVEDTPAETYEEETEEAEETQEEPTADSNQPETVDDFLDALLNPQETAAPTTAPVADKKDEIERRAQEFKSAGEQSKKDGNSNALANNLLQNAKVGDTITDNNGEGYEVTEVKTRKDGAKEIVLVPFELVDGKKDYSYSGLKLISENNKKAASGLYEFSYTNNNGERITETYNYNSNDAELSDSEGATQPTTEVKPGVAELFESNPELANEIYTALGFNDKEITIGKGLLDHDNFEADIYPIRINDEDAGYFTITKRDGANKLPIEEQGFISGSISSYGIELEDKFRGKGFGERTYLQIAKELAKEGITLKSEFFGKNAIGNKANSVWQKLVNKGYAVDKGEYFEVINPYTPQQKQQAQQLYSQYLDSIFPDSKVKDIVYHGGWASKETGFDLNKSGNGEFGKGIYFTPSKESAAEYLAISGDAPNIILAIVDLKNPVLFDDKKPRKGESKEYVKNKLAENPNNDGIIHTSKKLMNNEYGVDEKLNDEVKVNSAEQIHVLGNKQDIEGFKEFVTQGATKAIEATQPTEQQKEDKPKKERRGPKSFNDFNVEEEEGRDIANHCNNDDPPF